MRHRVAVDFAERLFKSSYNQLLNWHDSDYVRQYEGIICTLIYLYSRCDVDWWPDDRFAGLMRERMFKIDYSSRYASHETATSSHIVKY